MADVTAGAGVSRAAWREALPRLITRRAVLREVEPSDARALAAALGDPEVRAFLPDGPTSEEGFARFIDWVRGERRAGRYLCFTVVPREGGEASGLFQLWPIEPGFEVAEFGCALGRRLWGTGLFVETATAVVSFAVDELGARRIECRSAVGNAAGAASLRKLGAVREGILRRCFRTPRGVLDHIMWSILAEEWDGRRGA